MVVDRIKLKKLLKEKVVKDCDVEDAKKRLAGLKQWTLTLASHLEDS